MKLQAPLLDNKELVTLVSITECRHRRLITLNHAVELAKYTDVSKRLETLIRVRSHKFSVRDLKRWMGEGSGPTVWVPILGWIELCPKFLTMVQIEKAESAEEMAKRGWEHKLSSSNWHISMTAVRSVSISGDSTSIGKWAVNMMSAN